LHVIPAKAGMTKMVQWGSNAKVSFLFWQIMLACSGSRSRQWMEDKEDDY